MNKPSKKLIKKLELLSQLAYDGIVRISDNGSYFVRLTSATKVDNARIFRPENITRGTFNKLYSTINIKYETYQNILLLTKTGRLLLGSPKVTKNTYKKGVTWKSLTVKNYKRDGYWLNVEGKSRKEVRKIISQLVFMNSKAKWLLDKPFFNFENKLYEYPILYNYKSLTEMRKDLGYNFISDRVFESLFTNLVKVDESFVNEDYSRDIFEILLCGKFFSEKSRKNIIIVLLNILSGNKNEVASILRELNFSFEKYLKRTGTTLTTELPSDLKGIYQILDFTNLNDDDDELPF